MLNLDTHIVLHALADELSPREAGLLREQPWSISAIVIWEIGKLAELAGSSWTSTTSSSRARWLVFTLEICRAIRTLDFRGDPADEIIAATSLAHGVPLVTRDRRIRRSRLVPLARP
jgi:PIN domain nuclease of toxin-antitoxin system